MTLCIGLLSGTSMDGIDAALVDVETHTLVAGIVRPYSEIAQQRLHDVSYQGALSPAAFGQLNTILGREFAAAVSQLLDTSGVVPERILAIGSHGQTIAHDASGDIPYTLQLGCAHTIAEQTGIRVVSDFRSRDVVVGGQGAPLAPLYHQALFGKEHRPLALVNVGGIANVTYLSSDNLVYGHDIGPGNALMDAWILKELGQPYDKDGAFAATGQVITPLLKALLSDPMVVRFYPKSLGREYFSHQWLASYLLPTYQPHDVQATLLALTVACIVQEVTAAPFALSRLALCGGGAHNNTLLCALRAALPNWSVMSTTALGVNPDFIEAMMFAWLAEKAMSATPLDFSAITGAKKPVVLGVIY